MLAGGLWAGQRCTPVAPLPGPSWLLLPPGPLGPSAHTLGVAAAAPVPASWGPRGGGAREGTLVRMAGSRPGHGAGRMLVSEAGGGTQGRSRDGHVRRRRQQSRWTDRKNNGRRDGQGDRAPIGRWAGREEDRQTKHQVEEKPESLEMARTGGKMEGGRQRDRWTGGHRQTKPPRLTLVLPSRASVSPSLSLSHIPARVPPSSSQPLGDLPGHPTSCPPSLLSQTLGCSPL